MMIIRGSRSARYSIAAIATAMMLIAVACQKKPAAPGPAVETAKSRVVELVFFQGDVLINGEAPELGDKLGTGFSVKTGPGARCDIVFDGGNALSVGQNAFVKLDFSQVAVAVDVERGGLSSVLKKLDRIAGNESFQVKTATAVAGVRGTSFCVWVGADSTYVCACNGVVRTIDAMGGNEQTLEAAHHSAKLYSRTGSGITAEAAGMLHHDDALLQTVADRIGYRIDWTEVDG